MSRPSSVRPSRGWFNTLLDLLSGEPKRSRPAQRPRGVSLRVERLETRELLSVNLLPSIAGVAYHDLTGNGFTSDDVRLPSVTATLWKDGGNGQFDGKASGGDDQRVAAAMTDSKGNYRFPDLAAGTYFVQQSSAKGCDCAGPESPRDFDCRWRHARRPGLAHRLVRHHDAIDLRESPRRQGRDLVAGRPGGDRWSP